MNGRDCLLGALAIVAVATGARAEPSKYCASVGDLPAAWNLPVLRDCVQEWTGERREVAGMLMRALEDNDRLRNAIRQLRESAATEQRAATKPISN